MTGTNTYVSLSEDLSVTTPSEITTQTSIASHLLSPLHDLPDVFPNNMQTPAKQVCQQVGKKHVDDVVLLILVAHLLTKLGFCHNVAKNKSIQKGEPLTTLALNTRYLTTVDF